MKGEFVDFLAHMWYQLATYLRNLESWLRANLCSPYFCAVEGALFLHPCARRHIEAIINNQMLGSTKLGCQSGFMPGLTSQGRISKKRRSPEPLHQQRPRTLHQIGVKAKPFKGLEGTANQRNSFSDPWGHCAPYRDIMACRVIYGHPKCETTLTSTELQRV